MTRSPFKRLLAAAALGAGLLAASAAMAADAVRVGSKIDTEGSLLGSIILQVLNANGIPTENKLQLGTTKIVRSALLAGEIDVYPEYTGNGAFFFNIDTDPAWKNAQAGYDKVKQLDEAQNKIVWLTPAPANNTWALAVRQEVATSSWRPRPSSSRARRPCPPSSRPTASS
jgi:osmoprotectant transport system substrate-binding protein